MKKIWICMLTALCLCAAGCGSKGAGAQAEETEAVDGGVIYTKDFGSFEVIDGWSQSLLTSDAIYLYAKDGTDGQDTFDNFAVEVEDSDYKPDQADQFREDMQKQIEDNMEEQGEDLQLDSGQGTTNAGDPYIWFPITTSDGQETTQYYILGDGRQCMIQASNFDGSEEADRAFETAVSSFEWAK